VSSLDIYSIDRRGTVRHGYGRCRNSWGGAMHVWDTLSQKYCGKPFPMSSNSPAVWGLFRTRVLRREENIALGFTFDRVWVRRLHLEELADALQWFHETYQRRADGHVVAPTLAEAAAVIQSAAGNRTIRGLCFNMTSVNCGVWSVEPRGASESRMFRFGHDKRLRDGTPWELFDLLRKVRRQSAAVPT
jgi:hypothetical protein